MNQITIKFSVLFEEPFWIGIFERENNLKYEVCKVTFGSEPKGNEVYNFVVENYSRLKFSRPIEANRKKFKKINPKRMQRIINKIEVAGIGTKAQQALKFQQEQNKLERKRKFSNKKKQQKEVAYLIKKEKRKEKHKGH